MTDATIEMDARQELLARLAQMQTEIVVIDGLLRKVSGTKIGGRLVGMLCTLYTASGACWCGHD